MSRIFPVRDSATVDISATDFLFPSGFNCIYVGTSGNLVVMKPGGGTQQYLGLAGGVYHPIQGAGIVKTGTTASNLVVGIS